MEYLMYFIVIMLSFCVAGVAVLLISVAIYIAKQIKKDSEKSVNQSCKWFRASPMDDYSTQCGRSFYDASESGNPITDLLSYCPYCAGQIECEEK
ncbi:hypothetical protein CU052_13425 [Vibrio harveyi]|uniref:hypothetical protein n=1 Tax=Vibrio harveyi TaxID=669 RepID=UPI000C7D0132|nr:hypothetical protein [Vibrio harveyi]AWB00234.1 hypothetical protein CU052_13425 [Vibrio harveyi]